MSILVLISLSLITATVAFSQAPTESALGERLVHDYERHAGIGNTPELNRISNYINRVGSRVAGALPSHRQYHFVFDPNPAFKSAFALPGGYIVVGGGLVTLAQTEDELANALAHEIQHVELGQVSGRMTELTKKKSLKSLQLSDFYPGYTKEEELSCDLNGQKLAARAGYSPAGTLTLLETFKALRHGEPEETSDKHPSISERIAQAQPLANSTSQKQIPLSIR